VDSSSEFGRRAERRLHEEKIAWLTTVDGAGCPQPVPVWFLWDGDDSVLLYSRPETPKLRAITANPRVSLNLDGNGQGGTSSSRSARPRSPRIRLPARSRPTSRSTRP